MASPQISFRLSAYQLARGLKILRTIEPDHIPSSLSQLVKTLYIDYLAKTSLKTTDVVNDADIAEIHNLINNKSKTMSLLDFQAATSSPEAISELDTEMEPKPEPIANDETMIESLSEETGSTITSVTDFSPPKDWNL